MSLADIVRAGVAAANSITARGELQATVTHEAWTGDDVRNKPIYAAPVARAAIVADAGGRLYHTSDGREVAARAIVTFLVPIAANGASGRQEPIDERDRITLPNGTTGPILRVSGALDPSTGFPYAPEVALGSDH